MKSKFSFLLFLLIIITSCSLFEEDEKSEYGATLYVNYQNPESSIPSLTINDDKSSDIINIETFPITDEINGRILFKYPAVIFKKDRAVYSIDTTSIKTERNQEGKWTIDDENFLKSNFSKSLDIVLVLDVSSSLGSNITNIKADAIEMVSNILTQNPNARIAVVKFSRGYSVSNFSSNIYTLSNFIEAPSTFNSTDIGPYILEGRNETALYEAINYASNLLNDSNSQGKGILTFTDGLNNFWFDSSFQSPDVLISNLENSNSIASYTIGFEGNQGSVNKDILKKIAVNGDYSFPKNTKELSNVFERFSNNIASIYDLIYDTNNAKFNGNVEYRFSFKIKQIN